MARIVIVRSSHCALTETAISKAFDRHFPDDFLIVDPDATLGEDIVSRTPPFALATARVDAIMNSVEFQDADIFIALAEGNVEVEGKPVGLQVAVAALIDKAFITFLFLGGQGDVVCSLPDEGGEMITFKEADDATALARVIAIYDAREAPKLH